MRELQEILFMSIQNVMIIDFVFLVAIATIV